jgi:hypothetical protein
MCGLDSAIDVCVKLSQVAGAALLTSTPTLLDSGANICLTGVLELLVDVESIAPLPISDATMVALSKASFPLHWITVLYIINHVFTARILWKLSPQVRCWFIGHRLGTRMAHRGRFGLKVRVVCYHLR